MPDMDTATLEALLAEARDIAKERREKAAESHMVAMMIRSSANPAAWESWQMAANHADNTARVLDQTADLARKVIAQAAQIKALREALGPCIVMLDALVAESGRGVDYGEEDAFRMGEWFEKADLAQIEAARAALQSEVSHG